MNKKITSSVLAAVMIAGTTSFSAFAAMASGTVVIGNKAFDLAYANDPTNLAEITSAIVAGGAVYIKDFQGNWIDNTTGLAVNAYLIPAVVYKNAAGAVTNFDANDTDAVTTTSVVSVSAINAKTLEVKFNKAVDATDAAITTKYAVAGENITKAVVSEDGKTVTLTTSDELKVSNAKVTISPIKTKADLNVLTVEFNTLLTFTDTTAASVKSVDAKGTTAVITFDEPIQNEGTVSLDGAQLSPTTQYTLVDNVLTITGLTADKSYKVDVVGATDFAGNISNPIAVNFTVAKPVVDNSKPTVTSTVNGTEMTFDFSEELAKQNLDANATVAEYAKVTVGTSVFYLTDAQIKDATDKTKFTLDVASALGTAKFINTTVKVEGQKDLALNAGDTFEFNATITKDTTPATLAATSTKILVADDTSVTTDKDALYLTFNEPVTVNGKITLKTKNGIVYTTGTETNVNQATGAGFDVDGNGKIEGAELNTIKVDMDLDSNSAYTFELAAGSVADMSGNVNTSVITFNAASGTFQTTPGTVTDSLVFAATTPVVVDATNNKVFTVEYATNVTTSATTVANYTLGGKALPTGTELQFVDGTKKVRFTLPEGAITANGNYVLEAKNVIDTIGNTLKDGKIAVQVPLKESVAPVASKINVVDSKNFNIDFSELLASTTTPSGIIVKINGIVVPAAFTTTNGKLAVMTTSDYSLTDAITVEFKATNLVDLNGNIVKDSVISK